VRGGARRSPAKPAGPVEWQYGRDLTAAARQGDLDPVIGRDDELARLVQIFGRKTKNNPVLIAAIHQVKQELARQRTEAARCERAGDLAGAADLEYVQLPELDRRLDAAVKALADLPPGRRMIKAEVDAEEIAAVVSAWTGVPVARLMEGEAAKLLQMEDMMRRRVVGQDAAVRAIAGPIRRNRAGLSDGARPIGTFLSVGPTGVGKTELARALAEFLFDDERAMVRIDMGEYQERHTVARLIGAPSRARRRSASGRRRPG
jgi:ATP-dependent Clp protease ATP-binding subunit ClpB